MKHLKGDAAFGRMAEFGFLPKQGKKKCPADINRPSAHTIGERTEQRNGYELNSRREQYGIQNYLFR